MISFPPTLILRHRKENLKKCSLRGLENRKDCTFFSYPTATLPPLSNYILLTPNASLLSSKDKVKGIFLIDATWRYATVMRRCLPSTSSLEYRSIPENIITAYPRVQEEERGLASIEALFIAYLITERDTSGLLDSYYWKDLFLEKNNESIDFLLKSQVRLGIRNLI